MKRVFLIVLDSLGAGAAPDAADFGDAGAHTLRSVSKGAGFHIPNLQRAGIGNIPGLEFLGTSSHPEAAVARLEERSRGKDTTIGHWELAGVISAQPMPTYPNGFPQEILDAFEKATGRGVLCNMPYSGTEVIKDYGKQHVETGSLIVYSSADSVFQVAAHEQVVPLSELYACCKQARAILQGPHGVGRVIARPFTGEWPYQRTKNRHDFSLVPPRTMLNAIAEAGKDVIAVGKISDIFAASGVTESHPTGGNSDGMRQTLEIADRAFSGLCFVNLVDFDMLYGHRQDPDGYAKALAEFDAWLPNLLKKMEADDLVMITADHGCDPSDQSTDHTREYVPLMMFGEKIAPVNFGTRNSFADVAATICELLAVSYDTPGKSFAAGLLCNQAHE